MVLPVRALKFVTKQTYHIPSNSDFVQYITKTLYMQRIFQVIFHGDIQILVKTWFRHPRQCLSIKSKKSFAKIAYYLFLKCKHNMNITPVNKK